MKSASNDLSKEKRKLADTIAQIGNGTKAILKGIDYPELQEELDKLRLRKSELEDIIAHNSNGKEPVESKVLAQRLKDSLVDMDTNLKYVVQTHITKIYAHNDGSFTVNIGVHSNGSLSWT